MPSERSERRASAWYHGSPTRIALGMTRDRFALRMAGAPSCPANEVSVGHLHGTTDPRRALRWG
jgi:hypothetical protein